MSDFIPDPLVRELSETLLDLENDFILIGRKIEKLRQTFINNYGGLKR